ncbi:hypothetical protein ALQ37_04975, partial [Pseudomonas syringae pv. aptata]
MDRATACVDSSRRPRPRRPVRRTGPEPHGGLVQQCVPGQAHPAGLAGRFDHDHQGATARSARQGHRLRRVALPGPRIGRQTLKALPLGSIVFNYLGQFDGSFDAPEALFTPSADSSGASQSADAPLAAPISINGQVYAGELRLSWTFSGAVFERETVQRLADEYAAELQQLIAHCTTEGVAGATPSDFPLARLSQSQLSRLPISAGQIEDLYPLAPMQQGMLFHTLFEQEAGNYINQMRIEVSGLDVPRFRAAWQATLDAHEVLRSAFISHLQPALQVVLRDVRMPFVELDARGQSSGWIDQWADADRQQGFDLAQGPLLRLAVLRTGEQSHQLIYTSHHILMDGWSSS